MLCRKTNNVLGHGVDADPVRTGSEFTAWTTDGVDVNMQPMKFETEMDDTMTSDGVPISLMPSWCCK